MGKRGLNAVEDSADHHFLARKRARDLPSDQDDAFPLWLRRMCELFEAPEDLFAPGSVAVDWLRHDPAHAELRLSEEAIVTSLTLEMSYYDRLLYRNPTPPLRSAERGPDDPILLVQDFQERNLIFGHAYRAQKASVGDLAAMELLKRLTCNDHYSFEGALSNVHLDKQSRVAVHRSRWVFDTTRLQLWLVSFTIDGIYGAVCSLGGQERIRTALVGTDGDCKWLSHSIPRCQFCAFTQRNGLCVCQGGMKSRATQPVRMPKIERWMDFVQLGIEKKFFGEEILDIVLVDQFTKAKLAVCPIVESMFVDVSNSRDSLAENRLLLQKFVAQRSLKALLPAEKEHDRAKRMMSSQQDRAVRITAPVVAQVRVVGRSEVAIEPNGIVEPIDIALDGKLERHPFDCQYCGGRFVRQANLNRHIREQHTKTSRFACPSCGKQFSQRSNMQRHYQSMHVQRRPHGVSVVPECRNCDLYFQTAEQLTRHVERVHNAASHIQGTGMQI